MAKILVVDDEEDQEELITQRFASKLFLKDYEFVFANNGIKGLEMVQNHPDIDFALLDINMPEMDGLSLLGRIKEINPMIQAVMLSAYGDMSNIRTAMNKGAFDFLNKPIDLQDLEITIKKTIAYTRQLKDNANTLRENLVLNQKATELEMQTLRAQMNPHFIFNSLNSINNFILKNEKAFASEYLLKFSKLIRMILENSSKSLISIGQELDALKLYMDLEALRFENKFQYHFIHDPDLDITSIKVPPLLLQPFVENAIHHGLLHKTGPGSIRVLVSEAEQRLILQIEDDGIGREASSKLKNALDFKKVSLGITLTKDRIALLNKRRINDSFEIEDLVDPENKPCGTLVTISLPLIL